MFARILSDLSSFAVEALRALMGNPRLSFGTVGVERWSAIPVECESPVALVAMPGESEAPVSLPAGNGDEAQATCAATAEAPAVENVETPVAPVASVEYVKIGRRYAPLDETKHGPQTVYTKRGRRYYPVS